jgi:hypothetical protein
MTKSRNKQSAKNQQSIDWIEISVDGYRGLDDPYQADGSSPYCTTLAHYKRSGYFDYYMAHFLSTLKEGTPEYKAAIKEVIDEMRAQVPNEDNLQKIQKRFVERNCLPNENTEYGTMFACACSGMKVTEREKVHAVDNLVALLSVPASKPFLKDMNKSIRVPLGNEEKSFGTVALKDVFNLYYSNQKQVWVYLHPQFVDVDSKNGGETCKICESCSGYILKNQVPPFSRARVNFGNLNCIRDDQQNLLPSTSPTELECTV